MITPSIEVTLEQRYGMSKLYRGLRFLAFSLLLLILAGIAVEANPIEFIRDLPNALSKLGQFVPPDFSALPELIEPAIVTLLLALIPLPLGVALAIPVAFAAASNISPPWLRLIARTYITIQRNLPEIVLVLVLVRAFGLGPMPGIAAIILGSVGMLAKLIADAIEEIDERALESVKATGASHWQVIRYGVVPEVMPNIIANSLFRLEINMRQAGLLGAVGAGGLGWELSYSLNLLEYERVTMTFLVMLLMVALIEGVSDLLRSRVLKQGLQHA
jgi:phosphonate transport system permease protein